MVARTFWVLGGLFLIGFLIPGARAAVTFPVGEITGFRLTGSGRMWSSWTEPDVNNDGWREVVVSGGVFVTCFDVNPANGGPKRLWNLPPIHHEACWGCDSGIDVNGDGITEQLAFEAVWNNHYLIYGNNGTAVPDTGGNDRRTGLIWPDTYCGTGLNGTDVNGNGVPDYVICGITTGATPIPQMRCLDGKDASLIWSTNLPVAPAGLRLVMANNSLRILTRSVTFNNQLWYVNNGLSSGTLPVGNIGIIPNGAGVGHDIALITASTTTAYNLSNFVTPLWATLFPIGRTEPVGDLNGDGYTDFGGIISATQFGVASGFDGVSIRNMTAQHLENELHGLCGLGDVDRDGYGDYGIFGDFNPTEIFSGYSGVSIIQLNESVELMFSVPDVNGNGYTDIMTFNHGCTVIDGSARGAIGVVSIVIDAPSGPGCNDCSDKVDWGTAGALIVATGVASVVVTLLISRARMKHRLGSK